MTSEEHAARQDSATLRFVAGLVGFGDLIASVAGGLAIACLCALLLLVLVQTAMGFLASAFPAAASAMSVSWEYAGYLMGVAFMFGMAQTLRRGGHIRVNVLFDALKPKMRAAVDLVASTASCVMVALLATSLTSMAFRAFSSNSLSTASLTPLWIPEGAFALASWLFALQLLIRVLALLVGLPPEDEQNYIGAPSE